MLDVHFSLVFGVPIGTGRGLRTESRELEWDWVGLGLESLLKV